MKRRAFVAAGLALLAGCGKNANPATATQQETAAPIETPSPTSTPTPEPIGSVRFLSCKVAVVDVESYHTVTLSPADGEIQQVKGDYSGENRFNIEDGTLAEVTVWSDEGKLSRRNPDTAVCTGEATPTDSSPDTDTRTEVQETNKADPDLQEAADALSKAVQAYADSHRSGARFHDVTVEDSTDPEKVREHLYDARDELNSADVHDLRPDQKELLADLRGVRWFLWWLPDVQNAAKEVFNTAKGAWDGPTGGAGSPGETFSTLDDELSQLKNDSDPEDMQGFQTLSVDDYDQRVGYYETARSNLKSLVKERGGYHDDYDTYSAAMAKYDDGEYRNAKSQFGDAASKFDSRADSISSLDIEGPGSGIQSTAECIASGMAKRARGYQDACDAGMNGEETKRIVREEEAEESPDC